jgi:hypothetical protein
MLGRWQQRRQARRKGLRLYEARPSSVLSPWRVNGENQVRTQERHFLKHEPNPKSTAVFGVRVLVPHSLAGLLHWIDDLYG